MTTTNNPAKNLRIEFHILQSFPVTCLNRDDVGAPKTAVVGNSTRARVSSQSWKRQVRLAMRDFGITTGTRTKLLKQLVAAKCLELGATPEQAEACGDKVEKAFIKPAKTSKKKTSKEEDETPAENAEEAGKTDTLIFLSPAEITKLATAFQENNFEPDKVITNPKQEKQAAEIAKIIGKPNLSVNGADIALFGRMVAQAPSMNVEAAASFAHAISTHRVTNEVEFFTALDDLQEDPGSAHMGSLEFNSATYYRYVSLDVGQLWETMQGTHLPETISAFIKALFVAVPAARQATQSGASPWEFARVFVRRGQRLQVPFETPVKAQPGGGFLENSRTELTNYLDAKEKLAGSLFQKVAGFDFGDNADYNIDQLIADILQAVDGAVKNA